MEWAGSGSFCDDVLVRRVPAVDRCGRVEGAGGEVGQLRRLARAADAARRLLGAGVGLEAGDERPERRERACEDADAELDDGDDGEIDDARWGSVRLSGGEVD